MKIGERSLSLPGITKSGSEVTTRREAAVKVRTNDDQREAADGRFSLPWEMARQRAPSSVESRTGRHS